MPYGEHQAQYTTRSARKFCNAYSAGFSLQRLKSLLRSRSVSAGETLRNFMFTVLGFSQEARLFFEVP